MTTDITSMVVDYLVFIGFIVISFLIPLWGNFKTKKKETKANYVFATGSVSMGAMMLSIARGTLGVRSFLGYPSELYYRGSAMWETLYGMLLAYPIVCFVFVPVYYSLGITSVYQYLDMRFKSKLVRCLASFSYVVRSLLNLGVTVFTPCVALKAVIGLPYWASIVGITSISVVFTIIGGLKAAILSDVIQGLTMIGVSVIIIIHGTVNIGGPVNVFNVTQERGRLDFFNFDMDPHLRVTTTSATIGQLFMSLSIFGCQQNFVQRYCSMSSHKKVVKTMMANIPIITILFSLAWIVGMVIFANYADCDPLSLGYISKIDEIVPFYVEDKFSKVPGMLGLVMATLFNSALTLAVSNLNSLATVTFEDFLSHIPALSDMKDTQQLHAIKIIGVIYGLIIIGISFLVAMLSGVIESSMLMTSATSGPLLGVFLLALLIPCANWKGAAAGMIFSHITTMWITYGHLNQGNVPEMLPLSTENCDNETFSSWVVRPISLEYYVSNVTNWTTMPKNITPSSVNVTNESSDPLNVLYGITYMYYALIGSITTVGVGIIVSLITADAEADKYEEHLLHPTARKIAGLFPGKRRLYVSNIRLGNKNDTDVTNATLSSVMSIPDSVEKITSPQGCIDDRGKLHLDNSYVEKLNALKNASLDVTNEIGKHTRL
ncbi:Sodium-coupled monocarboxylate transporter 2 [Trachymyrmex septentrionalis]|uniref:Sodium-coupled monocarboxylate transporter 2 n=1 Tax=Trachymyrmex septentrionalis TaxID=34720 RepID=A0A195FJ08_9HYME|nr:PREDICTED: sodium-coupled monocarboxylate transporter 2 [Trachymyrmex septentrionalis]XP_018341553.1 PREDICTED: sodium-coupled monocarboxylate transporter 2 [Trachymyrmex septentrionalis]XP_018341554.1 PREDICTED: sodium-coupled monocarboxylate transporter 2 [Trachymyrmex septentrionalis]XP_018341555.1 PREDICTED: sodium-coupled monocarboxylate transporter 2 [Trachymyrmex septentrionalis]KYN39969.1 Sodium-coupled monocarboxylate transporter 2 [Trachymyrmex septentrionalis]